MVENLSPISSIECRFVVHIPKTEEQAHDMHVVKEVVHREDGSVTPQLTLLPDFKRQFWLDPRGRKAEGQRPYHQKKESEKLSNLREYETTQSELEYSIAKAMGMSTRGRIDRSTLFSSPYLYGADILSTAIIKKERNDKFEKDHKTPFTVAYLDTETNMLSESKHVILSTVYHNKKIYTAILNSFFAGHSSVERRLREAFDQYMPQQAKDMNLEWEFEFFDKPSELAAACLMRCHTWKPDFLSIWNMNFDIPKLVEAIEKDGLDPKDYFSDPSIPPEYRFFYYRQDNDKKVSASGKTTSSKPADLWHTVYCPASFYVIDQMCAYRSIRKAKTEEPTYALDAILRKHLKDLGKLEFAQAEGLSKADFHIFMQENYPFEYTIYNLWDAVSMDLLTQDTKDLTFSVPTIAEHSDFRHFNSQPRRYVDKFHYFCLKHDEVVGTSGKSLKHEFDELTVKPKGWIITLETHLTISPGLKLFWDADNIPSFGHVHAGDQVRHHIN